MATILFVMKYPLHQQQSLSRKFDGQMAAVRALGHQALCIGWRPGSMWLLGEGEPQRLRSNRLGWMPGYSHTKIFVDLMAALRQVVQERQVALVYLRYMPTFWNAPRALRAAKAQGAKLVVEFPTYPREGENNRSFLRRPVFAYADWVLHRITPQVDLFTAIGEPCGDSLYGRPAMNIENGVDVEALPLHQPAPGREGVHLLALASMMKSHGYDRVLRGMAAYQGDVKVHLHMAGSDGDGSLEAWKRLVAELGLEERVTFYDPLYGQPLNDLVNQCDVGLGALAMFRFGLEHGMPLKLREYMARGLPFVYAAQDAAIPQEPRFCLAVPHDESPLYMERIVAFALQARQDAKAPEEMRAYAMAHMSWKPIMERVLGRMGL